MNWYVMLELSRTKQAELLKEAQNRRRTAKGRKRLKKPSPRGIRKVNNIGERLFIRDLQYHKQVTDYRPVC